VTTRRPGGIQPDPLSVRQVVDAAMQVTRQGGLDQMTLRAVASELGVTPPALHHHVASKEDLRARVCEAVAREVSLDVDESADWRDQYVQLVLSMDRTFARYPGVAQEALTATGGSPGASGLVGRALQIGRGAGLSEAGAGEAFFAVYCLFTGWLVTREVARSGQTPSSLQVSGPAAYDDLRLAALVRTLLDGFEVRRAPAS
jgi:TetR/AcrR family tetracycline transcriptional repressor